MARTILVTLDGSESSFGFSRLDRKKLYATRKRVPLDADGDPCQRATLTDDGSMLVTSGMTGQGYFDAAGRWVQTSELIGMDTDGKPVEKHPSTLGAAQALTEVEPDALLNAARLSEMKWEKAGQEEYGGPPASAVVAQRARSRVWIGAELRRAKASGRKAGPKRCAEPRRPKPRHAETSAVQSGAHPQAEP